MRTTTRKASARIRRGILQDGGLGSDDEIALSRHHRYSFDACRYSQLPSIPQIAIIAIFGSLYRRAVSRASPIAPWRQSRDRRYL